jgi:DNA-binding transcriptional MerR regulator
VLVRWVDREGSGGGRGQLRGLERSRPAHVATSTVRYYERRGLLSADARRSGQRRDRPETLRRLVLIGMLQDAGLALDDIGSILHAFTVTEWKGIAARALPSSTRRSPNSKTPERCSRRPCSDPFDHPATDCRIMGAEIDRRLDQRSDAD